MHGSHGLAQELSDKLWSFDLFVLCFASAVVGGAFAVVGFFDFVAWLGHDRTPEIGLI